MAHTLPTLWQRLFDRAPSGYRPGVTLAHLQRNLGLAGCEVLGPGSARYALADGSLAFEVRERTESQLLMHLVLCEFRLQVPCPQQGTARLALQHTGALRRSGLRWRRLRGEQSWQARLEQALAHDPALQQALMPLDFKRLHLDLAGGCWTLTLEHMGGSEVVNRMPAFRRYISLNPAQRDLLLAALKGLARLVEGL